MCVSRPGPFGHDSGRPGRPLAAPRSGPGQAFEVLVVYKYDRLGRNFLETVHLLQELEALGIRVLSATEGDNPFLRNILLTVADNYPRQLSAVSRDGMRQTAQAGYSTGGRPPTATNAKRWNHR